MFIGCLSEMRHCLTEFSPKCRGKKKSRYVSQNKFEAWSVKIVLLPSVTKVCSNSLVKLLTALICITKVNIFLLIQLQICAVSSAIRIVIEMRASSCASPLQFERSWKPYRVSFTKKLAQG